MKVSLQREAWHPRYRHALTLLIMVAGKVLSLKRLSSLIKNMAQKSLWNMRTNRPVINTFVHLSLFFYTFDLLLFKTKLMVINLHNRHFLKLLDFTPEEIKYLLDLASKLKKAETSWY